MFFHLTFLVVNLATQIIRLHKNIDMIRLKQTVHWILNDLMSAKAEPHGKYSPLLRKYDLEM